MTDMTGTQNQRDAHDWTPLLWALRVSTLWGVETDEKKAIIEEHPQEGGATSSARPGRGPELDALGARKILQLRRGRRCALDAHG